MTLLYVNVHLLGAERRQGLNHLRLPPWVATTPASVTRVQSAFLGCTPMRGGRSVDAPPWKRHLPPAPIPASLHGRRVGRDVAVHLGSAASAARALCIGVIGIATRGKCRGIQSYRSSSRNAVDLLFQHQNLRQGIRALQGNGFPIYIVGKHSFFTLNISPIIYIKLYYPYYPNYSFFNEINDLGQGNRAG